MHHMTKSNIELQNNSAFHLCAICVEAWSTMLARTGWAGSWAEPSPASLGQLSSNQVEITALKRRLVSSERSRVELAAQLASERRASGLQSSTMAKSEQAVWDPHKNGQNIVGSLSCLPSASSYEHPVGQLYVHTCWSTTTNG